MLPEASFGPFINARLTKIPFLLLMVGFRVAPQIFEKLCPVITFFTRVCDSKVNTFMHLICASYIEFFFAVIAREFGSWLVQMYVGNVFLKFTFVTIDLLAIFTILTIGFTFIWRPAHI